jgi:hypothetical protein
LKDAFRAALLPLSERLLAQRKDSHDRIYSLHAPEVECIAKGKAHKKYEFGNKAALVTTSREGFALGCMGLHGNPYDGHTLAGSLELAERLCGGKRLFKRAYVDRGYKGHGYTGEVEVHISRPWHGPESFPESPALAQAPFCDRADDRPYEERWPAWPELPSRRGRGPDERGLVRGRAQPSFDFGPFTGFFIFFFVRPACFRVLLGSCSWPCGCHESRQTDRTGGGGVI